MRLFETPTYSFIPNRKKAYIFSGTLLVIGILSLLFVGLDYGIDFQGGREFVIESSQELQVVDVRSELTDALGSQPEVKKFDADKPAVIVRALPSEEPITATETKIVEALQAQHPDANFKVVKTDVVGPRFAEDLQWGAIQAILFSLLIIFVYIMIRFEWRFSVGAVAALFHDVLITLGLFAALHTIMPFSLQIDQAIIAAFLTIVGYSLNDTVVIFDRIREDAQTFKTKPYDEVVNTAINNTLSRTVVTSLTTLLVVVVLFIFGGEVLRGFTFALIIGICVGTYSSIFVASPIVVELYHYLKKKEKKK